MGCHGIAMRYLMKIMVYSWVFHGISMKSSWKSDTEYRLGNAGTPAMAFEWDYSIELPSGKQT